MHALRIRIRHAKMLQTCSAIFRCAASDDSVIGSAAFLRTAAACKSNFPKCFLQYNYMPSACAGKELPKNFAALYRFIFKF